MSPQYENLINSLIEDGYLKTPEIIEAFKQIDRADFVPDEYKADAYVNAPLPIGFNQTISQPLVVAFMLELLEPKARERILDIGSGSGWVVAILTYIVSGGNPKSEILNSKQIPNPKSQIPNIITIERIPELKKMAEKNISKYGFLQEKTAEVILGDGSNGYAEEAPYDKIIAGAAAQTKIPDAWKEQLKIGGRIVAPVGNSIVVIDKISKDKYEQKEHFGFSFVPLIKGEAALDKKNI